MVDFVNTNPDNGGSPILLLELQMDNGAGGAFVSIFNTTQ